MCAKTSSLYEENTLLLTLKMNRLPTLEFRNLESMLQQRIADIVTPHASKSMLARDVVQRIWFACRSSCLL